MERYSWSEATGRYYDRSTGRFVSRVTMRLALDDVLSAGEARARAASEALRRGSITLAEWQAELRDVVKLTHLQAEALARGGWDQLSQADFGRVGAAVREQYRYLANFTDDLRGGLPTDGRFLTRADMYAKAARPFFHDEQKDLLQATGYEEERSILHEAEHCLECVDMAALGWVPIGTVVPIGDRQCMGNCRCTMGYR